MTWSPDQYLKFERQRAQPALDLLARLPVRPGQLGIDLGCGPGNSTEMMRARLPDAELAGLDNSPEMIAAAQERMPGTAFALADAAAWAAEEGEEYDVIFSNAALQWVPDHAALFPNLLRRLKPGGVLAVQMPDNLDEPAHALMRRVAAEGPWAGVLAKAAGQRTPRQRAEWYYGLLAGQAADVEVWITIYHHPLAEGADGVVEWFRGSGLRPFLAPLDEGQRAGFLARYREEVARAYPALADGTVLLPFPRLFILATR